MVLVQPAGDLGIAGAPVAGASIFLQALVILKVTEVTQTTGVSPLLSFAVGQDVVGVVVFAGNMGGRWAADAWAQAPLGLSIVRAAGRAVERAKADADVGSDANVGGFSAASVERFAKACGLAPQEAEVLPYLLRGRTLPSIAERLFVIAGMVKTHALHIYRKAGAGSREELIDAIDAFERREDGR